MMLYGDIQRGVWPCVRAVPVVLASGLARRRVRGQTPKLRGCCSADALHRQIRDSLNEKATTNAERKISVHYLYHFRLVGCCMSHILIFDFVTYAIWVNY